MGQTYQHILVRADATEVVAAMLPGDNGYALPLGDGLSALLMDEREQNLGEEAERLSGALRTDAATVAVVMSDHLLITVYRDGREVWDYDSAVEDEAHRLTEGPDGKLRFPDGTVFDPYHDEFPPPKPSGTDPRWITPFATVPVDAAAISGVLANGSDEPEGRHLFAEAQHGELYGALGLPELLTGYGYLTYDLPSTPDLQVLFADAIPFGDVPEIVGSASTEGVS
ncbi:hypothetical protein [Yinghuangia sp. YIM S09857]|uniref:hypothetical protein n=1 Tax=Yinghuangia sp. YIM S09857 TaxID=3436929 RepID=UPI003F5327B2